MPTLPAAWLTFADGAVYKAYDIRYRLWGIGITTDQQLAGAIMKTGGSMFLWAIVIFIFFKRFASGYKYGNTTIRRPGTIPDAELTGDSVGRRGITADHRRRRARVRRHALRVPGRIASTDTAGNRLRTRGRPRRPVACEVVIDQRLLRTDLDGVKAALGRRGSGRRCSTTSSTRRGSTSGCERHRRRRDDIRARVNTISKEVGAAAP